jgi:undecaprenyl-diphosphatase
MSIWEALILGIIQGATEFLPVSSSGHLVLMQKIFGISEPALFFDTALHAGTLIAVVVVLWRDVSGILRRIFQPLTLYLAIATIPAVITALLFRGRIEEAFSSASFLGFAFLLTSALLFLSEKISGSAKKRSHAGLELPGKSQSKEKMNSISALVIGLLQAVAVIPGVSRSGATISAALFRRLDRDFAARFSFLLSIPAILGALVLQAISLVKAGGAAVSDATLPIVVGTLSACIVAFFSVRLALKIVREHSLVGFSIYTGILGLLVLIDKFATRFFF